MKTQRKRNTITKTLLLWALAFSGMVLQAQVTEAEKKLREVKTPGDGGWTIGNSLSIAFSQVTFTNWASGGQNSVSVNGRYNGIFSYLKDRLSWDNQVDVGYGILMQGANDLQKTDDRIELMSKAGYRFSETLNGALLGTFKTQFAPGYAGKESSKVISDLLAPAYLVLAAGADYKPSDKLSLFIAPLTGKITLVYNDSLSAAGAFGVEPGRQMRAELGGYLRMAYKTDLMQNVALQTKVDLFSNYLKDPQFVDVSWEVLVMMKINKYLSASINTHLLYDHDILIGKDLSGDGEPDDFKPRIQFKELVGIGLAFTLPQK